MKIPTWAYVAAAFFFLGKKKDAAAAPASPSPWRTLSDATGKPITAAVVNGNKVVAFSAPVSAEKGSAIVFDSAQPGVVYQLVSDVTATTGMLDKPYTGATATAARVSISP